MAKKKTITVIVGAGGTVKVEADGFTGKSCEEATKWIEEALGERTETKYKPEYHKKATVEAEQKNSD